MPSPPRNSAAVDAPALVSVAGGAYRIGNDHGRADERPAHGVRLAPFRVAVGPVTNAEYRRFVVANGAAPPPFLDDARFNDPDQPVVGVSWFDAVAYCGWLGGVFGLPLRLPTEAEREVAARGGARAADWPWQPDRLDAHPAYAALAMLARPHVPRPACANRLGLLCMADNVHEWCSDWYASAYYAASPADQPAGPPTGSRRGSRGGSWRHQIKFTRLSARSSLDPAFRYNDYGFRVYADG